MLRMEECNDELNENITKIEFFNQHIKHLLLDDKKFKAQTSKIDRLGTDMENMKTQINSLVNAVNKLSEKDHTQHYLALNLIQNFWNRLKKLLLEHLKNLT